MLLSGEFPFHVAGFGTPFEFFPLIVKLASPGKGDFHLDLAVLEVQLRGNDGESFLFDAGGEQMNFSVMKQELLVPVWILQHIAAAIVRSYAHADDEGFAGPALDEAVAEADLT